MRNWLRGFKFDPTGELAVAITISALAIAGPTAGLLWFMHRALQGERQTLVAERATARRNYLQAAREAINTTLKQRAKSPLKPEDARAPGLKFLDVVKSQRADSCLILDDQGRTLFPIAAEPQATALMAQASQDAFQQVTEFHEPIKDFSDNWQSLLDRFRGRRLLSVTTPGGRLYTPYLQLAAYEEARSGSAKAEKSLASLREIISQYGEASPPSGQRLYLAHQLRDHLPDLDTTLLTAERTAVSAADRFQRPTTAGIYEPCRTDATLIQVMTEDSHVILVHQAAKLKHQLEQAANAILTPQQLRAEVTASAPPAAEDQDILATQARTTLGETLRTWHLVAHDDLGISLIDSLVQRRKWQYSAIAIGGSLLLNLLAALAIQRFTRSANLTQARQDFLSTLSHELRTPLTSIRMFVDTLSAGGLEDPARARTYLEFIRRENERLTRLAENFLTFTRIESGRMNFDFHEISADEVVDSARVAVETRFAVEGTDFQISVERKLPMIKADHTLLTTAVVNLLENAFKYTPPDNKKILLSVARGHNTVRFTVADNGPGLTPDQMKYIGERFYRPDSAARSGQPGFGLGLNIVSHILHAHKGRLEIHTEPSVGSRFTLILPALQSNTEEE
jgi:signal transduction histidine kinase